MGTLADSMFSVLMSWVRALVSAIWALFGSERTTALEFLGKNWLGIAALMIVIGLVVDWLVWLLRWRPYHIWAKRARRLLRMEEPEDMQDPGIIDKIKNISTNILDNEIKVAFFARQKCGKFQLDLQP